MPALNQEADENLIFFTNQGNGWKDPQKNFQLSIVFKTFTLCNYFSQKNKL